MTEPDWAVVQEVETVTGDFLTEPGVPFYRIVIDGYCADFDHRQAAENFVAAIQRAFDERERELREALVAVDGELRTAWEERSLPARCISGATIAKITKALATRQDAPVTENSDGQ